MNNLLRRPIIFIGVPRAGTTIISEIIFQHNDLAWISNYQNWFPNMASINRVRPLLDNNIWSIKGQKQQLNRVPIYNRLAFKPAEAYGFWEAITNNEVNFSKSFLLGKTVDVDEQKKIRSFFYQMVKYQNKRRLAFKITGPARIEFLTSIFPDALFIEIQRDPFSNIRSLLKVPFWEKLGKYKLWWEGAYTKDEKLKASEWENRPALVTAMQYKKIKEITKQELKQQARIKHLKVTFEDFVQNTEGVVNEILEFVELARDSEINRYIARNKIYNRNVDAKSFFCKEDRDEIIKLLNT